MNVVRLASAEASLTAEAQSLTAVRICTETRMVQHPNMSVFLTLADLKSLATVDEFQSHVANKYGAYAEVKSTSVVDEDTEGNVDFEMEPDLLYEPVEEEDIFVLDL